MNVDRQATGTSRELAQERLQDAPKEAAIASVTVQYFDDLHRGQKQRQRAHNDFLARIDQLQAEGAMTFEEWIYAHKIVAEDAFEDQLKDRREQAEREQARRIKSAASRVDTRTRRG